MTYYERHKEERQEINRTRALNYYYKKYRGKKGI